MSKIIQAVRGMNDILPSATPHWQHIENILKQIITSYGYQEIRFPIVEQTELFARTIGDVTDIVEKEMYTFNDRNDDSLTLRPEGTAGCVRACIEHGLLHNQIQRLWYVGAMFRHERPQKGRYRQFHQFGAEVFGLTEPYIDAELILLSARFWQALGIQDKITLEINTLGDKAARAKYTQELVTYLEKYQQDLDKDSQNRLHKNPLRILDSKNPVTQDILNNAPKLIDYLDDAAREHFAKFKKLLDAAGIKYTVNSKLVRGLDYYGLTVFEWIMTEQSGAQNTVCAGGRYNTLAEKLGGKPTPALGFALGLERLVDLVAAKSSTTADVYIITASEYIGQGLLLAEKLHADMPNLRIINHCDTSSMKAQFKRADKSGAIIALIIGEEEMTAGNKISVKYLRENKEQQMVTYEKLLESLFELNSRTRQSLREIFLQKM